LVTAVGGLWSEHDLQVDANEVPTGDRRRRSHHAAERDVRVRLERGRPNRLAPAGRHADRARETLDLQGGELGGGQTDLEAIAALELDDRPRPVDGVREAGRLNREMLEGVGGREQS